MFVDYFLVAETWNETELLIYFHARLLQAIILNAISMWVTKLKIFAKVPFFWKGKINISLKPTILVRQ
jgi:hypothetical protein